MWTYPVLRAHLDANYSGLSDAAAAAALAAETEVVAGGLTRSDAVLRFIRADVWGKIQVRASRVFNATGSINLETAAAKQVVDAVTLFETFDLSDSTLYSALQRDLSVLVTLGDITAGQRDAILAVRDQTLPRWRPTPTEQDVAAARALGV